MANEWSIGYIISAAFPGDGGVITADFTLPRRIGSIQVFVPDLVGAGTVALHAKHPTLLTYFPVFSYNASDSSFHAVTAVPESQCTVIPATVCGSGVFRWVSTVAQNVVGTIVMFADRIL